MTTRRDVLTLLGGAAAAGPVRAIAQQTIPTVGLLRSTPERPFARLVAAMKDGLAESGFLEGRNVVIDQRWADNNPERLRELAADLVRQRVAVIVGNQQAG